MLEYRLDDLHWAEFEKLCQALLKARLAVGVEAWGGSGDWGNDAYCQAPLRYPGTEVQEGPFQFQAKFVEGANAAGARPRAPLVAAVKRECERIKKRKQPSPRVYSLLTNVVLSPQLRETVKDMIRDALPHCVPVVHGGNDICSWLHAHKAVVQVFPKLLSYRDLPELMKQSLEGETNKTHLMIAKPELSATLKKKKKQARAASRKHNVDSARRLWDEVRKQAEKEGNKAEEIGARLQTVLVLAQNERNPDEAMKLADACLQDAKTVDLGDDRCHLLQLIGEVHRIKGNRDQARGFITSALEHARKVGSPGDEGFALLSLSALERPRKGSGDYDKALAFIELAYNAFSALYADSNDEKQKVAKDGFAQCHCMRAKIFDYVRPDDALAEWTRALKAFQSLGEGWEWNAADTLLHRADLRGRIGEEKLAAGDLDGAAKIFQQLGNTVGLANCYLNAGELLDSIGKRDEAAEPYQQAATIAATWKNDSRAFYFYFRHACKLVELRKYEDAERIFSFLANADWLERKLKLTVISQLCVIAQAMGKDKELKERSSLAVGLIDELIEDAASAEERRSLLTTKAQHLKQAGQHDQALQCLAKAIERFEEAGDHDGVIECWFHICGVMRHLKDRKKEREAAEKVLALGSEKTSPMLAAMTLVMLAQINIDEQRFFEADKQLCRAKELDPKNPVVGVVAADLHNKLPKLSPRNRDDVDRARRPPDRDLPSLIEELHEWCAFCPSKRKSILAVWYYIHRTELWGILRSVLGVKFLICAADIAKFDNIKMGLSNQGDLFIWGTSFNLEAKKLKSVRSLEKIPVPSPFLFPAGVHVVSRRDKAGTATAANADGRETSHDHDILKPIKGALIEPYYLTFMKNEDRSLGSSLFFVGRKQTWRDLKIVEFMLGRSANEFIAERIICVPLSERGVVTNLRRTMEIAWETDAIPIFSEHLPHSGEIVAVCDSMIEMPSGAKTPTIAAKEIWTRLLSSCSKTPKLSLVTLTRDMAALSDTGIKDRVMARVYLLRFQAGSQEVIHPAVVIASR